MEDCPALNTRKLSANRLDKVNGQHGELDLPTPGKEESLLSSKSASPLLTPNEQVPTELSLSAEKIKRIKKRARRASERINKSPEVVVTPKSKATRKKSGSKVKKTKLQFENSSRQDIRSFLNNSFGPDRNSVNFKETGPLSETGDKSPTSFSAMVPVQKGNFYVGDRLSTMTTNPIVNNSPTVNNLQSTKMIVQHDHKFTSNHFATLENTGDEDTQLTESNNSKTIKESSNANKEEIPLDVPDFDNMSSADMMKTIYTTMTRHKEELKVLIQNTESRVDQIAQEAETQGESISSIKDDLAEVNIQANKFKSDIESLQEQVKILQNTVIRQEAKIEELQSKDITRDTREMQNNITIKGLTEKKGENCNSVVINFFENIMKIDPSPQVLHAHRLGKNKNRLLLVKMTNTTEKNKVYENIKNLKEVKNEETKSYSIQNQRPAMVAENQNQKRNFMWKNKSKMVEQLEMSF